MRWRLPNLDLFSTAPVFTAPLNVAGEQGSVLAAKEGQLDDHGLPLLMGGGVPLRRLVDPALEAQLLVKRVMDVVLSGLALVVLTPLFLFVAALVRLDSSGPAFFLQTREGCGGRPIRVLKFRTMHMNMCDPLGVSQAVVGDVRVTGVGRFLRKTSIDELPQIINVLKGDMSLVGPRPHVSGMIAAGRPYQDLVPYYRERLAMRPGLTGWAQVNGLRGETETAWKAQARIDHDIAYIQSFSIMLDVRILGLTVMREFITGHGN